MLYIYNNYTNDLFYRAWKNRIKLLKEENQTEIYQTLCILQSEPCRELFECRMKQFINTWAKEEPAFINYFRENYQNRAGIYCVHYTLCTYNTYWIHIFVIQKSGPNVIATSNMEIQILTCTLKGAIILLAYTYSYIN